MLSRTWFCSGKLSQYRKHSRGCSCFVPPTTKLFQQMFDGNAWLSGSTEDDTWESVLWNKLFGQIPQNCISQWMRRPFYLTHHPALWCAGERGPTSDEQWFNKLPFPPADRLSLCETMLYFLQFISRPSVCDNMPVSSEKGEFCVFLFRSWR